MSFMEFMTRSAFLQYLRMRQGMREIIRGLQQSSAAL
jgi:hypothetical protein